jgi:hypothetical protein
LTSIHHLLKKEKITLFKNKKLLIMATQKKSSTTKPAKTARPAKQSPIVYKRGKVQISGDPNNTKWPMWFDLITNKVFWLGLVVIVVCILPKDDLIPTLLKLLKLLPFMTLFVVVAVQLSG